MVVYFQGVTGAYSEEAVQKYFGKGATAIGLPEFEDVFAKVEGGASLGIIPVENTISGSVYENYDLLLKHDVKICGEYYLRVLHNLVAIKKAKLSGIKSVYSHIQALLQCKKFLKNKGYMKYAVDDTANAAKTVSRENNISMAAIASKAAARIYGLKILKEGVQDSSHNITRFIVIAKTHQPAAPDKISLVFGCQHKPGSLLNCLKWFKKYSLNITKVESRPIPDRQWEYVFYIDATGSFQNQNKALAALKNNTNFIKVLGQYKAGKSPV